MRNLLDLAGFEIVTVSRRILFPKKIPLLSTFLNGFVAYVWPFSHLCLTYWIVARPKPDIVPQGLTGSIVVPCRKEAGVIAELMERIPEGGSGTEIPFV